MSKLLSPFEAPESGEGNSALERAGNYVFDLVTVTVGAAVPGEFVVHVQHAYSLP